MPGAPFSWHCSTTVLKRCSGPRCSCYASLLLLAVHTGSCVFTGALRAVCPNILGKAAQLRSDRYPMLLSSAQLSGNSFLCVAPVPEKMLAFLNMQTFIS